MTGQSFQIYIWCSTMWKEGGCGRDSGERVMAIIERWPWREDKTSDLGKGEALGVVLEGRVRQMEAAVNWL